MAGAWKFPIVCVVTLAIACGASLPVYHENLPSDDPAIRYDSAPPEDGVQNAADQLTHAAAEWQRPSPSVLDMRLDRLARLLHVFNISPDSQTLVFSKTSFQAHLVSPRNPRAVYSNLNYAVGYVRGSPLIEVAALDARGGARFYTFNLDAEDPVFQRQQGACLRCHQGVATQGVPGLFVGSVFPDREGNAARKGAIVTDYRTPFAERWGGWYVDGLEPAMSTRANSVAQSPAAPEVLTPITEPTLEGYLRGTSNVSALMSLEHQTQAANLITRLSWLARLAGEKPSDSVVLRNELSAVEDLFQYVSFADGRLTDLINSRPFAGLPEGARLLFIRRLLGTHPYPNESLLFRLTN